MSKTLVIVESPAKARTISQFLGKGYDVKASFGHVRDLPESAADIPAEHKGKKWAKLGVNVDEGFEPLYVVSPDKKSHVAELRSSAKDADTILLATDEDREGESISWHVLELIKPKKGVTVQRIVFHEITKEAIDEAIRSPRQIDQSLVKAQETRRILDRLYGYTLSPLLWKKIRPKLSAGRVQSVAVRLVVIRERERRDFVAVGYGSITANLAGQTGKFKAKLQRIGQQAMATGADFNETGELTAKKAYWLEYGEAVERAERLQGSKPWTVAKADKSPGVENPPVPFMTSSLQQEAARKLGFTARRTMQIAQTLYEGVDIGGGAVGLITYMRTDSLTLAEKALSEARTVIKDMYGPEYLPQSANRYKSKSKNAQEAHEAIRPTDLSRTPSSIKNRLTDEQFKLYDLIWKRTLACQMVPARVERTRVEIDVRDTSDTCTFGTSGKRIVFPGFLRAYVEGSDDPEAELGDKETILPDLTVGQVVEPDNAINPAVIGTEHFTAPPARYTEASLVKKLEEEGIGRPSTYASIIGTIQDRGYVLKSGQQLVPTFTAFAVTQLLEDSFAELVDIKFTAGMEDQLDQIADDNRDMVQHLKEFYYGCDGSLGIAEKVEKEGPDIPFPTIALGQDIIVRIGRNGAFVQRGEGGPGNTASVPDELSPAELSLAKALELLESNAGGTESIGKDPATGQEVFRKSGRFGDYLEVGAGTDSKEKPKRVTLPPGLDPGQISEADLATLLAYPITLGKGKDSVQIMVGKFGAYLVKGTKKANVGDWREAAKMSLVEAEAFLSGEKKAASTGLAAIKEFGELEGAEGPVFVRSGRFGPYVTDGTTNATIPKGTDPAQLTADQALELLDGRRGKAGRAASGEALAEFGTLDGADGPVKVLAGRYGPYVTDGKTNATLPKGTEPANLSANEALDLLLKKKAAGPTKKRRFTRKRR